MLAGHRAVDLAELFEDDLVLLRLDAWAAVVDGERSCPRSPSRRQVDRVRAGREFDRVDRKIVKHLLKLRRSVWMIGTFGSNGTAIVIRTLSSASGLSRLSSLRKDRRGNRLGAHFHSAGFDLGQIEQIVDQVEQVVVRCAKYFADSERSSARWSARRILSKARRNPRSNSAACAVRELTLARNSLLRRFDS